MPEQRLALRSIVAKYSLLDGRRRNDAARYGSARTSTALHVAALNGHLKIVEALLDSGAAIDAKSKLDMTPLHVAAMGGNAGVVRLLIERKADVRARDIDGKTPLDLAVNNEHSTTAGVLRRAMQ